MRPLDLAVKGVQALNPYVPGKPIAELERELGIRNIVKLASNENPLGPSPLALEAAARTLPELHLYPDGGGFELKAALAEKLGVGTDQITLGNGSNDVLDMIARAFLGPEHSAVFSQYAFAVYPIVTQAVGAKGLAAPAHDGASGPQYGHDLQAMARAIRPDTRVVFIANPNNPTGTYLNRTELDAFLRALPGHLISVIDEAYFEYVQQADYPNALDWLHEIPNLVVTRTFSKAYGLAGLRVGYAVSNPEVADILNRLRQPFNVNTSAMAAACAALDDSAHLQRGLTLNDEGLELLGTALRSRGLAVIPSVGNFLSFDLGRPAAPVYEALLREGIIVRPIGNYGLPNHLRVTVGTAVDNRAFIDALDRVLAE
jgi:histidinol-phosphate aminotransferase